VAGEMEWWSIGVMEWWNDELIEIPNIKKQIPNKFQ
jgi:hypothetical protein